MPARITGPKVILSVAVAALLVALPLWIGARKPQAAPAPLSTAEARVSALAAKCLEDRLHCAGGFVETKSGTVRRIENRGVGGFVPMDVFPIGVFESYAVGDLAPHRLNRIVLPDDPEWKDFAVRHALGYVAKK